MYRYTVPGTWYRYRYLVPGIRYNYTIIIIILWYEVNTGYTGSLYIIIMAWCSRDGRYHTGVPGSRGDAWLVCTAPSLRHTWSRTAHETVRAGLLINVNAKEARPVARWTSSRAQGRGPTAGATPPHRFRRFRAGSRRAARPRAVVTSRQGPPRCTLIWAQHPWKIKGPMPS